MHAATFGNAVATPGSAEFHHYLSPDAYTPANGPLNPAAVVVFDSQEHAHTQQVTAKGYDTMTGVGTPNGAAFIAGLRRRAHPQKSVRFPLL